MDLNELRAFLAVARTGSLLAAAEFRQGRPKLRSGRRAGGRGAW
jgi:hypothetical protein